MRFGIPQREIGVSDKNIPYFCQNFDTFSQGGVLKYELQTCSITSTKLPGFVTVTIIIRMCR